MSFERRPQSSPRSSSSVQVFTRSRPIVTHVASSPAHAYKTTIERPLVQVAVEPVVEVMTAKDRLRNAEAEDDIASAVKECLAADGLPKDADLLAKALSLKEEKLLVPAMERLLDLMERGRPKNAKLLVQKIVAAHDYLTDEHALELAKGIRTRLS